MPNTVAALRELGIAIHPSDGRILSRLRFVEGKAEAEANFLERAGMALPGRLAKKMVEQPRSVELFAVEQAGFWTD